MREFTVLSFVYFVGFIQKAGWENNRGFRRQKARNKDIQVEFCLQNPLDATFPPCSVEA